MKLIEQLEALNLSGKFVKDYYQVDADSEVFCITTLRHMTSELTVEKLLLQLSIAEREDFYIMLYAQPALDGNIGYNISIHLK